jgi:hypothetical protein
MGGSSCPLGLGLVAPNAPNRSGRDRRTATHFYENSDNLTPQEPTPTSRPPTSSRRPDHQSPIWTSSGLPDTETQDPRRAGGRSPDRPQALTKPGRNRIGDRAVNAAGGVRQEVSDALGRGHEAGATRTPLALEHLGGVDGLDHLARGVTVPSSPEEVEAAAGIAVVNVCRALRLVRRVLEFDHTPVALLKECRTRTGSRLRRSRSPTECTRRDGSSRKGRMRARITPRRFKLHTDQLAASAA